MTLVLDAHPDTTEREVAHGVLGHGYRLDGVALMLAACRLKGIVEFHISVQRIILRTDDFLRVRIIKRCCDLGLVGEQFAQFQAGRHGIRLLRVSRAL